MNSADSQTHGDWIEWNGGECPVEPDALVEVIVPPRLPKVFPAGELDWAHGPCPNPECIGCDIIAYRVVKP